MIFKHITFEINFALRGLFFERTFKLGARIYFLNIIHFSDVYFIIWHFRIKSMQWSGFI